MAITQVIKTDTTAPTALIHASDVVPSNALSVEAFVDAAEGAFDSITTNTVPDINIVATQLNIFSGQANALAVEVNGNAVLAKAWATSPTSPDETTSKSAKTWAVEAAQSAIEAAAAVATLPEGTMNDALTTLTNTWSAIKIDSEIGNKQDTLVSGTNIKSINGASVLGSGNLSLLPSTNPSITGSITEEVYELTGTEISPSNGTIQYKTVSENTTFTETLTDGQSLLLRLIDASSYTITFPTITWVGAVAPILTANCAIVLWKEQSTLYGAYVGTLV